MTTERTSTPSSRKLGFVLSLLVAVSALSLGSALSPAHAQLLPGDSLVIDSDAGTNGQGALFRVSPATGTRLLLSDFGTGVNQSLDPFGVAVEAAGTILVSDVNAGTNSQGALFRVDPSTGARTLLSDFGTGANQGRDPFGVAVEAAGTILVSDETAGTNFQGALFRVDPSTGARTLLSNFGIGANQGVDPFGVAVARVPRRLNSLLTFVPLTATYSTTADPTGCPATTAGGKFSFNARLTNANAPGVLGSLVVEVKTLSNGNLVQNAQGGPGGVGARLVVPLSGQVADGRLGASEFVDVPLVICLANTNKFSFFVDVLGVGQ